MNDARLLTWVLLVGGNLAIMGLSLGASVAMTHRMSQFDYGSIALGTSLAAIVTLVTRLGADRLLLRDMLQHPDQADDYVTASYCLRSAVSLLCLLLLALAARLGLVPKSWPLSVVLVYVLLGCLQGLAPTEIYDAHGGMRRHALNLLWSSSLSAFAVLVLLFASPASWHRAVSVGYIQVGSTTLGSAAQLLYARRLVTVSTWSRVKKVLPRVAATYSAVALPSIGSTIMVQFPSIQLASRLGTEAVAPYGIAMTLASVFSLIFLQLGRVLNPDIVRRVRPGARRHEVVGFAAKYLSAAVASSAVLCLVGFLVAPLVFRTLFPAAYGSAVLPFRILLFWVMVGTVVSYPILQVLLALNNHSIFALGVAVGMGSSIALSHLWVGERGAVGAATALLASNSLLVLVTSVGLARLLARMSDEAQDKEAGRTMLHHTMDVPPSALPRLTRDERSRLTRDERSEARRAGIP